ncbi:UNVERIFIED_CONTAM: Tricyclene synthase Oc15, chloroplastic [Sesamum angustifolium]|uniref:Tricyclene synthase Oc15, chloroplastic n=1 Tax=Sesamum angustifolium TaxID=2727405 RepID=A0AAW2PEI8_9LAMI
MRNDPINLILSSTPSLHQNSEQYLHYTIFLGKKLYHGILQWLVAFVLPLFFENSSWIARIGKIEPARLVSMYGAGKQKWSIQASGRHSRPHQDCPDKFAIDYEEKIDEIRQRVGLSSYYEEEIETLLLKHYVASCSCIYGYHSLHDVSLLFRLLRQHGHYISPDVFNNFRGKDGRFRRNLSQDIRGLMELYEAAQLSFQGEYILDEAARFSSHRLRECLADVDDEVSRMITSKLKYPHHKTIARLTRKDFLQDVEGINGWGKTLRELALMDLRKGQSVYQGELAQVSKWWNELSLAQKLKLVRNQLPKWYTWSMSILIDDFSLSLQRVALTKSIAIVYLIDDIFVVVGTLDELTIFTEAVNKWDYAAVDTLPDYMKMCYLALLDTTNNIGREICKRHGHDPIDSLKASWGTLCSAFLVEAKWLASGDLPTADKYLENAKDEHQDGRDGSYSECYRKDHRGLSVAQARDHAIDTIASEWKNLNKECFRLYHLSASSFKRASLNLARITPLMYDYDDNQRLPVLEEYVKFMLLNHTT